MTPLASFTWGVFPYICLTVMVVGTIYRYQSDQLGWGSKSSEMLEKKLLTRGSMLFHIGIFFVLGGHIAGLLVPMQVYTVLGISPELYHLVAQVAGGAAGLMAFAGISILLYRRIVNARVRRNSDLSDYVSDGLLWIVILLGLAVTLGYSTLYGPYEYRATVGPWIRSVLTLQPDVALMAGVPLILQVHIALAFLLFGISPFTRLIHMYSFPIGYLTRAPIQYRARYGFGYDYEPVAAPRRRVGWGALPHLPLTPEPGEEQPVPEPVGADAGAGVGAGAGAGAGARGDKYAPSEPVDRLANGLRSR